MQLAYKSLPADSQWGPPSKPQLSSTPALRRPPAPTNTCLNKHPHLCDHVEVSEVAGVGGRREEVAQADDVGVARRGVEVAQDADLAQRALRVQRVVEDAACGGGGRLRVAGAGRGGVGDALSWPCRLNSCLEAAPPPSAACLRLLCLRSPVPG